MDTSAILNLIRTKALQYGVDPALLATTARAESGLNPQASTGTSSAKGLFQFTDPTWAQYGLGRNVFDPAANVDAGARFTADNISALRRADLPVTPATVYLAHFAGARGATDLLRANPDARASSVLSPAAIKANPFLANMTVSDVRRWAQNKVSGSKDGLASVRQTASAPVPRNEQASKPFIPTAADLQGYPATETLALLSADDQRAPPKVEPISFPTPPGIARARQLIHAMVRRGGVTT